MSHFPRNAMKQIKPNVYECYGVVDREGNLLNTIAGHKPLIYTHHDAAKAYDDVRTREIHPDSKVKRFLIVLKAV